MPTGIVTFTDGHTENIKDVKVYDNGTITFVLKSGIYAYQKPDFFKFNPFMADYKYERTKKIYIGYSGYEKINTITNIDVIYTDIDISR